MLSMNGKQYHTMCKMGDDRIIFRICQCSSFCCCFIDRDTVNLLFAFLQQDAVLFVADRKIPSEILDQVKPRSTADGSWGMKDIVKPEKYYTVTFDVDGEKESVSVKEGEKASEKEAPQKEGYTFLGLYLEDQKYDFETPVSTDITLCAKWEKNETPTPDPLPDIDLGFT